MCIVGWHRRYLSFVHRCTKFISHSYMQLHCWRLQFLLYWTTTDSHVSSHYPRKMSVNQLQNYCSGAATLKIMVFYESFLLIYCIYLSKFWKPALPLNRSKGREKIFGGLSTTCEHQSPMWPSGFNSYRDQQACHLVQFSTSLWVTVLSKNLWRLILL